MIEHLEQEQAQVPSKYAPVVWLAVLFGLATFTLNYTLERRLESLAVFEQYNVLFDTDPNARLKSISGSFGSSWIHPHFSNVFGLPIKFAGKVAKLFGLKKAQERSLRRSLGLLVIPIVSGATASVLFLVFFTLRLSVAQSAVLTCIGMVSFSQMVFVSVPDHFAAGGLTLALGYLLAAKDLNRYRQIRWSAWIATGVLTAGITFTNIVSLTFLLFTCLLRRGEGVLRACRSTIFFGIVVLVVTYATAIDCAVVFRDTLKLLSVGSHAAFVETYLTDNAFTKALQVPAVVANTIAPPNIAVIHNTRRAQGQRYNFQFTLENTTGVLPILICIVLLVSGTIGSFKGPPSYRFISMASLAILGFNLAMHCFFGMERFLYSQHWLTPLLVLFGGNLTYRGRYRHIGICVCSSLLVVEAANNFTRFWEMFSLLGKH